MRETVKGWEQELCFLLLAAGWQENGGWARARWSARLCFAGFASLVHLAGVPRVVRPLPFLGRRACCAWRPAAPARCVLF